MLRYTYIAHLVLSTVYMPKQSWNVRQWIWDFMSGRFVFECFILILFHERIDVWTFVNLRVSILCSFFYKINGINTRSVFRFPAYSVSKTTRSISITWNTWFGRRYAHWLSCIASVVFGVKTASDGAQIDFFFISSKWLIILLIRINMSLSSSLSSSYSLQGFRPRDQFRSH